MERSRALQLEDWKFAMNIIDVEYREDVYKKDQIVSTFEICVHDIN